MPGSTIVVKVTHDPDLLAEDDDALPVPDGGARRDVPGRHVSVMVGAARATEEDLQCAAEAGDADGDGGGGGEWGIVRRRNEEAERDAVGGSAPSVAAASLPQAGWNRCV